MHRRVNATCELITNSCFVKEGIFLHFPFGKLSFFRHPENAKAGYVALHGKDPDCCVFQFLMLLQEIVFCFILW